MGAKIFNSNLTKEIIDGAKLQILDGGIPSEIAEKVIPVMEVNPNMLRKTTLVKDLLSTNNTGGAIFTTSSSKDTYITGSLISLTKDVNSTVTDISVRCVVNGQTVKICYLATLTLTVDSKEIYCMLANPLKVDRNSSVNVTINGGAVGNHRVANLVFGYEIDNITA